MSMQCVRKAIGGQRGAVAVGVGAIVVGLGLLATGYFNDPGCQRFVCFSGYSNAASVKPRSSSQNITYLGTFAKATLCEAACLKQQDCNSFTWHEVASKQAKSRSPLEGQCFAIHHKSWSVMAKDGAVSGRPRGPVEQSLHQAAQRTSVATSKLSVKAQEAASGALVGIPIAASLTLNATVDACQSSSKVVTNAYESVVGVVESTGQAVLDSLESAYLSSVKLYQINGGVVQAPAKKGKAAAKNAKGGSSSLGLNLSAGWNGLVGLATIATVAVLALAVYLVIKPSKSSRAIPDPQKTGGKEQALWIFQDMVKGRDSPADPADKVRERSPPPSAPQTAEDFKVLFAKVAAGKAEGRVDAVEMQDLIFAAVQEAWTLDTCNAVVAKLPHDKSNTVKVEDLAKFYARPGAVAEVAGKANGDVMGDLMLKGTLMARQAQHITKEAAEPGGLLGNVMGGIAHAADGARHAVPPAIRVTVREEVDVAIKGFGDGTGKTVAVADLQDLGYALGEIWTTKSVDKVAAKLDPSGRGTIPADKFAEWFLKPGAIDEVVGAQGVLEAITKLPLGAQLLSRFAQRKANATS